MTKIIETTEFKLLLLKIINGTKTLSVVSLIR